MKRLFVDTAGWVAAADADDPAQASAVRSRDEWLASGGLLVTTDYVIDETLTTIRMRMGLAASKRWWKQVDGTSRLRIEVVDPERCEKARVIFFGYQDKDFSFTDCTSFVVMDELRVRQVLTLDHHFAQMGYEVLPFQA